MGPKHRLEKCLCTGSGSLLPCNTLRPSCEEPQARLWRGERVTAADLEPTASPESAALPVDPSQRRQLTQVPVRPTHTAVSHDSALLSSFVLEWGLADVPSSPFPSCHFFSSLKLTRSLFLCPHVPYDRYHHHTPRLPRPSWHLSCHERTKERREALHSSLKEKSSLVMARLLLGGRLLPVCVWGEELVLHPPNGTLISSFLTFQSVLDSTSVMLLFHYLCAISFQKCSQ